MNKHRLKKALTSKDGTTFQRAKRDTGTFYKSHLEAAEDHLRMAHAHMSYWLGGYNDRGILTDISNSAFNVRERYRRRQGEA